MNVSVIGAGSTYGIFLVKWAMLLKHFPETNRNKVPIPPLSVISYSNTTERNRDLVIEVLMDDLSHMPRFEGRDLKSVLADVHGYTNWREMLTKEDPGLVVLSSPLNTHVPYLREIMSDSKAKNILCEPPLCHIHEMESLPRLIELAREKGVTIGINQQYAFFYEQLKGLPLSPAAPNSGKFGDLLTGLTGLHIVFTTHGTRLWRKMQAVGEQEILEDLGPHVWELIPQELRNKPVTVKNVKKEGDNLFLNFVEYDLKFGDVPAKITLGYHRRLKNLKVTLKKGKKDYEFSVTGAVNPDTGEFTRWIEGKNYAYPFKHFLDTDLVKSSFIHSLAGKPAVSLEQGIKTLEFIKTLHQR
ncbi:MAG: hypothetical protein A3A86_06215 [Elusimicrobia bacterium RIFCSPLOWO2_01_FULL_60_11]|nr:MAG: hypothetical protein A3A86_06215 [Elusimicrobia bacterium RIFCSPLOWO2_01_FULL_60_11]